MPLDPDDPRTYSINGAAMEVYNQLHRGLAESLYCEALAIEFGLRAIPFESRDCSPASIASTSSASTRSSWK